MLCISGFKRHLRLCREGNVLEKREKEGAKGEKIGLFTELPIPIIKHIYYPHFYYKDFIAA
jgi:hypothetical protein